MFPRQWREIATLREIPYIRGKPPTLVDKPLDVERGYWKLTHYRSVLALVCGLFDADGAEKRRDHFQTADVGRPPRCFWLAKGRAMVRPDGMVQIQVA